MGDEGHPRRLEKPCPAASLRGAAMMAAVVSLFLPPAATAQAPRRVSAAAPRADFTILAGDYFLRLPASVPAGWRTVRFHNDGRDFHHAVFLRVRDRRGADSALAALAAWREDWDRPVPGTTSIGGVEGSFGMRPTEDTYAVLDLRPGLYLVLCMIPSGGALHVNRGMHALLRVTAASVAPSPPPLPHATLRLADYAYRLSPRGRLAAGWRLVEITSIGPAEHVAEVARLRPGRHLADVLAPAGAAAAEDPEAAVIGGGTRLAAGQRAFIWLHLTPGAYVVQCPLRATSRQSHMRRGMVMEFQVR